MWQWYNCCAARVPHGKLPLRINVDETSICLFQGQQKGTIVFKKRKGPPADEPYERASRAKRRACLTHVAFICDRPDIQPLLPQVIVANEATFLVRDFAALQAACPPNVHLVRQKSAWNNKQLMTRIISMLALAIRPHLGTLQPILFLDACRVHTPAMVLYRCLANGIWPIMVPAKLTWLLQPCDTHAFQRFKVYLKKSYQAARVQTEGRELCIADFLACIYSAIRYVLQGNLWDEAFDADGFGHSQERLSNFIQRHLQMTDSLSLPASLPTEDLLKLCFPRGAKVPHRALLRPLQPPLPSSAVVSVAPVGFRLSLGPRVRAASLSIAAAAVHPVSSAGPSSALAGREPRTRSEHRLVAELAKGQV